MQWCVFYGCRSPLDLTFCQAQFACYLPKVLNVCGTAGPLSGPEQRALRSADTVVRFNGFDRRSVASAVCVHSISGRCAAALSNIVPKELFVCRYTWSCAMWRIITAVVAAAPQAGGPAGHGVGGGLQGGWA